MDLIENNLGTIAVIVFLGGIIWGAADMARPKKSVERITTALGISQRDLIPEGASQLAKSVILRDVASGTVPRKFSTSVALPFNVVPGDTLIWVFAETEYYEMRTHREYVGSSAGWSFKIVNGLYYRTGRFQGRRVETESSDLIDVGLLGVTDRHLHFAGTLRGLRIPLSKIANVFPYEDAIGIQRDGATAKTQTFKGIDGEFAYDLISNLSRVRLGADAPGA